jgi:hypothetical protein
MACSRGVRVASRSHAASPYPRSSPVFSDEHAIDPSVRTRSRCPVVYASVPPNVSPQSPGFANALATPGLAAALPTVWRSTPMPSPISLAASRAANRASACAAVRASSPAWTRP